MIAKLKSPSTEAYDEAIQCLRWIVKCDKEGNSNGVAETLLEAAEFLEREGVDVD